MRALLLLVLAISGCSATASDQPPTGPSPARVVVTGQGQIDVAPDRASFSAGVTTESRSAETALAENNTRTGALIDALQGSGIEIEELQTQGANLHPVWEPRPRNVDAEWRPRIVGYRASNRLQLRTADLARVGELMAIAAEAGANDLQGIQFSLHDEAAAKADAIRQATRNAQRHAEVLADASNTRILRVLELRLDHAHTNLPAVRGMMVERFAVARTDAAPVPVEAGTITVNASVTLTAAIE